MRSFFSSLSIIINYRTFLITFLSIFGTWLCVRLGVFAEISLSMVSVAIVFPIVFAINSAYQRREEALRHLAGIKGHAVSVFLAVKHWGEHGTASQELLSSITDQLKKMLNEVKDYLKSAKFEDHEMRVYSSFSHLSNRLQGMRSTVGSSEMSRINEYVSMITVDFEELKIVREYRTPITLRTYSRAFIFSFPILLSPSFASSINIFTIPIITYVIPLMYSFILISLINIQEHMEDPFDGIGEDDIKIQSTRFGKLLDGLDKEMFPGAMHYPNSKIAG